MKLSHVKPGDLFNRRECGWYISAKHKDAVLWLGLIAYAKKDWDVAKAWWEKLYRIDSHFRDSDQTHAGSTPGRLLWNLENNRGGLYGTKEQLDVFKNPRSRMMVLIADLELENVNLSEAERKFKKMLEDKEIQANREMAAYCTFAMGVTLMSQFNRSEANNYLENFLPDKQFSRTQVSPRALLYYANNIQARNDVSLNNKKIRCYRHIIEMFPRTAEAEIALYCQGEYFLHKKKKDEAINCFRAYLKKHPKGFFCENVREYMKKAIE